MRAALTTVCVSSYYDVCVLRRPTTCVLILVVRDVCRFSGLLPRLSGPRALRLLGTQFACFYQYKSTNTDAKGAASMAAHALSVTAVGGGAEEARGVASMPQQQQQPQQQQAIWIPPTPEIEGAFKAVSEGSKTVPAECCYDAVAPLAAAAGRHSSSRSSSRSSSSAFGAAGAKTPVLDTPRRIEESFRMLEGCHGAAAAAPPLVPPVATLLQTREHELESEVQRLTAQLAQTSASATSRTSSLLASARLNTLHAEARGLEAGQGKAANGKGHALGGGGGGATDAREWR